MGSEPAAYRLALARLAAGYLAETAEPPPTKDEVLRAGMNRADRRRREREDRRAHKRDPWQQTDAVLDQHAARRRAADLTDTPKHAEPEDHGQEFPRDVQ